MADVSTCERSGVAVALEVRLTLTLTLALTLTRARTLAMEAIVDPNQDHHSDTSPAVVALHALRSSFSNAQVPTCTPSTFGRRPPTHSSPFCSSHSCLSPDVWLSPLTWRRLWRGGGWCVPRWASSIPTAISIGYMPTMHTAQPAITYPRLAGVGRAHV